MEHGNRTTLGWKCHTRAAPSCDIFNLGFVTFPCPTHYRASSVKCRWDSTRNAWKQRKTAGECRRAVNFYVLHCRVGYLLCRYIRVFELATFLQSARNSLCFCVCFSTGGHLAKNSLRDAFLWSPAVFKRTQLSHQTKPNPWIDPTHDYVCRRRAGMPFRSHPGDCFAEKSSCVRSSSPRYWRRRC